MWLITVNGSVKALTSSSTHGHSEGQPPRPSPTEDQPKLPARTEPRAERPIEGRTPPHPDSGSQPEQPSTNGSSDQVSRTQGERGDNDTNTDGGGQPVHDTDDIVFDRTRSRLRMPETLVNDCLRFNQALTMSRSVSDSKSAGTDKVLADNAELASRLRSARVMTDDQLDPMAENLLNVCSQASLIIKVNLSFANETSASTVWATPREAVVSSSLDPSFAEFRPVDVAQLPLVLSELMVLRRPSFVGQSPVSVGTKAVAEAETQLNNPEKAIATLVSAGLSGEQARLIIDFQGANVRRWRVSSSWSTDDGSESSELRGLDAGPSGQWLVAMTGNRNEPGQMTFTPQGAGEVVRALRSILPRSWVGIPLRRQANT